MRPIPLAGLAVLFLLVASPRADGPADNVADKVRRIPPPGIAIPATDRSELEQSVTNLAGQIQALARDLQPKPALASLLPDVEVFHKAVDWALRYGEFYRTNEVETARALMWVAQDRIKALQAGKAPWLSATGLVVRAYRSKIDGSIQPYGLVVPDTYRAPSAHRYRVDCWFHGRGENLTELAFLNERLKSAGEFAPPNTIVLHLYGRYCNANKLAGEVDLFEALEDLKRSYPVDEDRIVVRGFSMGGAACWQFAVHYPGHWAAAAPGAGFAETPEFLRVFQNEKVQPTWYERKLWHLYDCPDYAMNLFNLPVVAYSGETDRQKQAADVMAAALAKEGITLTHIIGPGTAHRYHPDSKREINRRIDSIAAAGRDPVPDRVRFTTWTLRYNQSAWLTLDGLSEHWEQAWADATLADDHTVRIRTHGVTALTLSMPSGRCPLDPTRPPTVEIDGRRIASPPVMSDRSWTARFRKVGKRWEQSIAAGDVTLQKRHGLQGPIDDAFLDRFLMVRPTGRAGCETVGVWVAAEMARATNEWRSQFRGDAPVKDDTAVTDADIASGNLVLWGDPESNAVLRRIADRLPIRWEGGSIKAGGRAWPAAGHVPLMVFPNPLNPKRYVVLNSGVTFREYDYLNNARQVPKLPDWAVVDLSVPPGPRFPGRVADAGFFDEEWKLKPAR